MSPESDEVLCVFCFGFLRYQMLTLTCNYQTPAADLPHSHPVFSYSAPEEAETAVQGKC